jgi:secreted trypsin-like serine protease
MRTTWVVLTGVAVAVGGCEGLGSPVESLDQPIIAGTLDTNDPAMMEMIAVKGNAAARCTATLITPRILLTAAHCVAETSGYAYVVFPGSNDNGISAKDVLQVKAAVFDPKFGDPRNGHDLAVIVLTSPSAIPPVPFNRMALDKAVGKPARYIGYGLSNGVTQSGAGVKRETTAPIAQLSKTLVLIAPNPHGACNGDSGGPMLFDFGGGETIVGIGSFVDDTTCRGSSYYQRVDTQTAWIDEQIQKYDPAATPTSDGGVAADARAADAASPPDTMHGGPLTGIFADARAAEPDGAVAPPRSEPGPDAGVKADARAKADTQPEPQPEPQTANLTSSVSGGCSYGGGAGPSPLAAAGGLASVLAWLGRRRRR